jgi:hypothetical protein
MEYINIQDTAFQHCHFLAEHFPTDKFIWNRDSSTYNADEYIVFTDSELMTASNFTNRKIGLILEPISIRPQIYSWIRDNYNIFDFVFTFDLDLINLDPNKFIFYPYGTTWIKGEAQNIYQKNKLLSIIASSKTQTIGHRLRHDIVRKYSNKIDAYGGGYQYVDNKLVGLKDYAFQIVVENVKKDYYFTEKIIDCFSTGTIPIYYGCPSIGDFFDINGILTFDNLDELDGILNTLSFDLYNSKINSISENFKLKDSYIHLDNLLFSKIKNL